MRLPPRLREYVPAPLLNSGFARAGALIGKRTAGDRLRIASKPIRADELLSLVAELLSSKLPAANATP